MPCDRTPWIHTFMYAEREGEEGEEGSKGSEGSEGTRDIERMTVAEEIEMRGNGWKEE